MDGKDLEELIFTHRELRYGSFHDKLGTGCVNAGITHSVLLHRGLDVSSLSAIHVTEVSVKFGISFSAAGAGLRALYKARAPARVAANSTQLSSPQHWPQPTEEHPPPHNPHLPGPPQT